MTNIDHKLGHQLEEIDRLLITMDTIYIYITYKYPPQSLL